MQVCEYCWRNFKSRNKHQKCCSRDCANKNKMIYKECILCKTIFKSVHTWQRYCSLKCVHESQKKPLNICPVCWWKFRARNSTQKYCSYNCRWIDKRTIDRLNCLICWKEFTPKWKRQRCCCRKHAAQLRQKEKWFMWNCQSPECTSSAKIISKVNLKYKKILEDSWYNVEMEYWFWYYSYDLKIWDILIEINPYAYHNSTRAPKWKEIKPRLYHYNKYNFAKDNWYRCIMVRDWVSNEELLEMIENKDFHYEWPERLIWYNNATGEHILDNKFDKDKMISSWFVEIYDCWTPVFTNTIDNNATR